MKFAGFLISALVTAMLLFGLNRPMDSIPPLGRFLSPFTGFWQNAEKVDKQFPETLSLDGLDDEVNVHFDERRVPHIIAKNDKDLYYMQGYIMARDRLWQMDFISYAASGRVSEIVGESEAALKYDRTQRRLGIGYGAEQAMTLLDDNPKAKIVMNAFADGVNAYINELSYRDYPVEYKLMGYEPEEWTIMKTAILLKFMAKMLASTEYDFENTNALKMLGQENFDELFPDFPSGIDPIIPTEKEYTFEADSLPAPSPVVPDGFLSRSEYEQPAYKNLGSNNWAVHGSRTASGNPILSNDPHLGLYLPSIWYEMQLTSPNVNTYGVTLPGSTGIIIGFNDNCAWGVTNAGRDVKDWYKIEFKDDSKAYYNYQGEWKKTEWRIETINIKGGGVYYDTVAYTEYGPVMYDESFTMNGDSTPMALKWTAHDPSDELSTFYILNRSKDLNDYFKALETYETPGQNFVFASKEGDIAIKQQGRFPQRWPQQGRFLMDGSDPAYAWNGRIPEEHNAYIVNPERGFVSSANQHPTDTTYPYYYDGHFQYYRNRRINTLLNGMEGVTPDDLKDLQNDNYNLMASEALPFLLTYIDPAQLDDEQQQAFELLTGWNFMNNAGLEAPSYFEVFWEAFNEQLWDEFMPEGEKGLSMPQYYNTINFFINNTEHELYDNKDTEEQEQLNDLVVNAFTYTVDSLNSWKAETGTDKADWDTFKATRLAHWTGDQLDAFFVKDLPIGGNKHIVNATSRTHGASWRMVVEMKDDSPQAWGIYPGGQSGNPGSPYYARHAQDWAKGDYYELLFLKQGEDPPQDKIIFTQTFKPAGQ